MKFKNFIKIFSIISLVFGIMVLSLLLILITSSIKEVENNLIKKTPNRSRLYIAQTPQVFNFQDYKKAFKIAIEKELDFTDDCQIVENIGQKVYVSEGDYKNIKITTQEDVILAQAIG